MIKDLGLNTVLVTCEDGASDVNKTGDYWGSLGFVRKQARSA